jgi:2-dehydropantoate 2-reductase
MNEIKKVYLIGLGAIGGAYAGRIQENCPGCLRVIVNSERAGRYAESGIHINGKAIDFDYIQPQAVKEHADLILIAVKQHHLNQTIEDIRGLVGPNTILSSLLNGISSEEIIGKAYGMDKMLHSFCVGTDSTRTGTEIRYGKIGNIIFGDAVNSGTSLKVNAVREFFDKANVPYQVPDDILREQWWKFMMNVGINQVSAVLRASYGTFQKPGEARSLMFSASQEVLDISARAGIPLRREDIDRYAGILDTLSPEGKTSMLQDVEAGRKTEVEIFAGTVMELGKKYGIPTPVNDVLYKLIKAIEQMVRIEASIE